MTEEYLDISCPVCGKRDKAGWIDSDDYGVIMCCEACDILYWIGGETNKKTIRED